MKGSKWAALMVAAMVEWWVGSLASLPVVWKVGWMAEQSAE